MKRNVPESKRRSVALLILVGIAWVVGGRVALTALFLWLVHPDFGIGPLPFVAVLLIIVTVITIRGAVHDFRNPPKDLYF